MQRDLCRPEGGMVTLEMLQQRQSIACDRYLRSIGRQQSTAGLCSDTPARLMLERPATSAGGRTVLHC